MILEPNPYEPPLDESRISLLRDHSVLTQLGVVIHTLVLIAYCFITVDSERKRSDILSEVSPRFHIAMAVCTAIAFVLVFALTITNAARPLYLRFWLIGLDLLLICFLIYVSQGFGTWLL